MWLQTYQTTNSCKKKEPCLDQRRPPKQKHVHGPRTYWWRGRDIIAIFRQRFWTTLVRFMIPKCSYATFFISIPPCFRNNPNTKVKSYVFRPGWNLWTVYWLQHFLNRPGNMNQWIIAAGIYHPGTHNIPLPNPIFRSKLGHFIANMSVYHLRVQLWRVPLLMFQFVDCCVHFVCQMEAHSQFQNFVPVFVPHHHMQKWHVH